MEMREMKLKTKTNIDSILQQKDSLFEQDFRLQLVRFTIYKKTKKVCWHGRNRESTLHGLRCWTGWSKAKVAHVTRECMHQRGPHAHDNAQIT